MVCYLPRAWKNHLRGVDKKYQLDLYQTLSLLENETDVAVFQHRLVKFSQYWKDKAPTFVQYFQQYYANRPGRSTLKKVKMQYVQIKVHALIFSEKWARCYRNFAHADTDTNMYLERLASYIHTLYICPINM